MRRSLVLLLPLAACQENKVGVYSTPPAVSIVSPADGSIVGAGELVELVGLAHDQQTDAEALVVSWESDVDFALGGDPPDVSGNVYLAVNDLSSGDHVITLTVVDEDAESASTAIGLSVGQGSTGEGAPTVVLLGPTDGQSFGESDTVNVIAAVTDGEDAYDTLLCEVIDVPDGSLWTGYPSATGSLTVPIDPSVGTHSLTLTTVDSDGNTATASVMYEVIDDGRPTVTITSPATGSSLDTDTLISFQGTVGDDVTDVELLTLSWSSDVTGVFSTNAADSSGLSAVGAAMTEGIHTVTLTAVDEEGKTGSDSVIITVTDPLNRDDDGDGYTENGGDCDDDDPATNPGSSDVCDDADNDCSGEINESWWDGYERNESFSAPYDCGEVDASLGWSNSTLTLSGLTFSDATDEDWFTWDADDEWYDNIDISISVTALQASGDYVVELYDESGTVVASDSGPTSLSLSYSGDITDTGEDIWYVRVYALSWPSNTCADSYSITIRS